MAGMTNFCPKIDFFFRFDILNCKSTRQTKVISWLLAYTKFLTQSNQIFLVTWKKES